MVLLDAFEEIFKIGGKQLYFLFIDVDSHYDITPQMI